MSDPKLPERFVGHGVIGRGGQAVVVLATDTLRGERVALKVIHPHLAADPTTRRRLRREVRAASLLHSDAALVPYDLHEVDGTVALSMPFHPGQTVAERVGAEGPLPPEDVRAIGVRVARALADAHGAGILHRDVSATNVLTGSDPGRDTVLADFGLARVVGQTATATRAAGTLGYAAPEVLASGRADARSDLYGLGAVLHLAATGRTVLDAGGRRVGELRPDLPADLAATIEALLRTDPATRPQSATEVIDALEQRLAPETGQRVGPTAVVAAPPGGRFFAAGPASVWIRETPADRERRRGLRRRARGDHPPGPMDELTRWGTHLVGKVRDALGIPPADPRTPEDRLVRSIEAEAGLPAGSVLPSPQLILPGFLLVSGIDREVAGRLADAAASAGFHAEVRESEETEWSKRVVAGLLAAVVAGVVALVAQTGHVDPALVAPLGLVAIVMLARGQRRRRRERDLVPAYEPTLEGALRPGVVVGRDTARAPQGPAPATVPEPTRGQALLQRAELALDALESLDDLPEPAQVDVRSTVKDLRRQAGELAQRVDRLERATASHGATDGEIAAIEGRLARLRALRAAGDPQDPQAIDALEQALSRHEADRTAADEVESELAATTARLLGIASTASRVHRELLAGGERTTSVGEGLDRLHAQARAARAARQETAAGEATRGRPPGPPRRQAQ